MKELTYRQAVLAVFIQKDGKILLGKRSDNGFWQFPQGGIDFGESPKEALYREMEEEIGCSLFDIVKQTNSSITYNFPKELSLPICKKYKGQSQKWFLCSFHETVEPSLEKATCQEFSKLAWFKPSFALENIVSWKKNSYEKGLSEFGLID